LATTRHCAPHTGREHSNVQQDDAVTLDEQQAPAAEPPGDAPALTPSEAALAQHVATMHRQRRWYLAALTVVVVLVATLVAVVWSRSEIVHAHLRTARAAAPSLEPGQLAAAPQPAWRTPDRTAIGAPLSGGTFVTYSDHTVSGRDARTGAVTWSYTRTDRTICQVVQEQERTVAFFRDAGNCDEVNAFETGTGRRAWERTLDTEGNPVNGDPTITPLADGIIVSTNSVIYAIRIRDAFDYWEYPEPDGCRMTGLAVGAAGALIAQQCADGPHLLLRDRFAGNDDKDHPVKWRLNGVRAVPWVAGSFVAALDPTTRDLVRYNATTGKVVGRLALPTQPSTTTNLQQTTATDAELIWDGEHTYTINGSGTQLLWTAQTQAVPNLDPQDLPVDVPTLSSSVALVAGTRGVDVLDSSTGMVTSTMATTPPPQRGSQVYPIGTGFAVAGSSTDVYR
jgi:PQQ-like domain